MAGAIGFNFTIGARMASSVASVFNTVSARAKTLGGDLRTLKAMSRTSGTLLRTQTHVADLRAQAAAGKDVKDKLIGAETALASAHREAKKYNITMEGAAKVHAQATAQIGRTEDALKRQQILMRNSAKRSELQGAMMGTIASAGMVVAPVKIAIDFESSMADAAKTIDGMRDEAGKLTPEYYKMESAVKSLGRELPLTHTEIASLFAAGGQMGMTTAAQLTEFSTLAAHMSVAFGMGTDAAADAIGGYKTKLGLTNEQVREMLDLTNQFANTSSATEKDIAGIVSRVGALGDMAGVAYKPMTAMAATLASMKVPEEIAATGLKNFMLGLSKGNAATKQQQAAFARIGVDSKQLSVQMQKDAEGAMLAVLEKIKALPKHEQTAILTQIFGSESIGAIAPMLTQLDLLRKNLEMTGDSSLYAGAMQKEFENRSKTTANNLIILKNKASEVAITMGSALLPGLNDVINSMGSGAMVMAAFTEANPAVVKAVMYTVTALAAFKVASLAGGYGMTLLSDALVYGKKAWSLATLMCQKATYAMIWQKAVSVATAVKTKALALAQWGLGMAMTVQSAIVNRVTGSMIVQKTVGLALAASARVMTVAQWGFNAAMTAMAVITNRATYAMIAQKAVSLAMAAGTALMTAAQWGLNIAMTANPIGLVVVGVAALCTGLYALYKYCEPVRAGIDGIWKVMNVVGTNVLRVLLLPSAIAWNTIKALWGPAKAFFSDIWAGVSGLAAAAWSKVSGLALWCWDGVKSNWSDVSDFFGGIWNGVKATAEFIFSGISSYISGIWEGIKVKAASVFDWIGEKIEWAASKVEWLTQGWETVKGWVPFSEEKQEKTTKSTPDPHQVNIPAKTQSSPTGAAMKPTPSVSAAMDRPRQQQSPPAHLPHAGSEGVPGTSDADMQRMLEDALKGTTDPHQVNIPAKTQSSPTGAAMKPMSSVSAAMDRPRRQQDLPALGDTRRSAPVQQGQRVGTDRLVASIKTPVSGPAPTAGRQATAIHPSLNLTVQLHGVSDRDFGDRVLDAVVDKKSEFERFLGGLMKNASRVAYE